MEDLEQPAPADSEAAPDLANPLEPQTSEANDAPAPEAPPVDDGEEIDYEGEKYKVPPKLKEAFLRQADYTVKTQTLAEQRRDFEAQQEQFTQRQQIQQQHLRDVAKVISIDERLGQFAQIDFNALTDADPVQALKLDRQLRELQSQRAQIVQSINEAQQRTAMESQQETAKRLQEATATLAREIKGFGTPEVTQALIDTGKAFGFTSEELAKAQDPRAIRLLHEAYMYRKLVSERKAEAKPTVEAKPITRITASKGEAARDPAKMSDKEFAAWRRKQISTRS